MEVLADRYQPGFITLDEYRQGLEENSPELVAQAGGPIIKRTGLNGENPRLRTIFERNDEERSAGKIAGALPQSAGAR